MMFKSHFGETVTVVLAIVMGGVMALASIIVEHLDFNFSNVFQIWSMITMVILLASIIFPYQEWPVMFVISYFAAFAAAAAGKWAARRYCC